MTANTQTFAKVAIDVSKKATEGAKKGQFVKQGEIGIFVPTLAAIAAFVAGATVKTDDKGAEVVEDGLPVFVSDEANWVQGALLAAVKAQARNKLVSGTAAVKEGLKIPESWAELCAEGSRNGGEALAILRDAKAAFSEFVAKLGKSDNAAATLNTLFGNRAALQLQTAANKAKMLAYVEQFSNALDEATLERLQKPIEAVIASCAEVASAEDF